MIYWKRVPSLEGPKTYRQMSNINPTLMKTISINETHTINPTSLLIPSIKISDNVPPNVGAHIEFIVQDLATFNANTWEVLEE